MRYQELCEGRTYNVPVKIYTLSGPASIDVPIYENPTKQAMITICSRHFAMSGDSNLRGFLHANKVYVWPAEEATHTAIQRTLGFEEPGEYDFYNSPDVANFHVRGYGWQDGDPDREYNILCVYPKDASKVVNLARRWGCSVRSDGDGLY